MFTYQVLWADEVKAGDIIVWPSEDIITASLVSDVDVCGTIDLNGHVDITANEVAVWSDGRNERLTDTLRYSFEDVVYVIRSTDGCVTDLYGNRVPIVGTSDVRSGYPNPTHDYRYPFNGYYFYDVREHGKPATGHVATVGHSI